MIKHLIVFGINEVPIGKPFLPLLNNFLIHISCGQDTVQFLLMQTLYTSSHKHLPINKYLTLRSFHPFVSFVCTLFMLYRCSSLSPYALKINTTITNYYLNWSDCRTLYSSQDMEITYVLISGNTSPCERSCLTFSIPSITRRKDKLCYV
jgi:hypothetical protein